ncbi:MAG: hypothetical protein U1C19_01995 [Methanobacteriaceae archaeon]|jgi:hypothetical protein|nr:hypothetical protein [Methanobacteriaceae archaeon]
MIIHVIGQISYKEGCLEKVVLELIKWENKKMVKNSLEEIIKVHKRYNFTYKSEKEAKNYIKSKLASILYLVMINNKLIWHFGLISGDI